MTFLKQLFAIRAVDASLFDEAFIQRVPLADVQILIDGYRTHFGALQAVTKDPGGDQLRFAHGSLRATLELDSEGKAAGLRFHDEQSETDRHALERVLRAERAFAAWFAQGFLDQLPVEQVDARNAQLRAAEGPFDRVDSRGGVYYAVFANAENIAEIATLADGKISYLSLGPAVPKSSP